MNLVGMISTAVLSLTLIAAAPVFAQEQHEQEEQKSKPEAQHEEKKAQPEKSAKQEQKPEAQQEKNTKPEERNAKQEEKIPSRRRRTRRSNSARRATVVAGFPRTNSRPILDNSTRFASPNPTTAIGASNTAAIRSDSLTRGPATGCTRKTFMLSRSTGCITCATHRFLALTSYSVSHYSQVSTADAPAYQ